MDVTPCLTNPCDSGMTMAEDDDFFHVEGVYHDMTEDDAEIS